MSGPVFSIQFMLSDLPDIFHWILNNFANFICITGMQVVKMAGN